MPDIPPKAISVTIRRLAELVLRVYLLFLAPLTYFQRSLIYQPTRCERLLAGRANSSQRVVDFTVRADDGIELNGWLTLPGISRGADSIEIRQILERSGPVVLYFPGNAGNRSLRVTQFDVLGSLDSPMVLVDYRGYGDNPGKPSELALARDARSIWNHLTTGLGVPPHRIVIYGESLGGGVATRLASDLCREGIQPGGLIIQSTFSSLVATAQFHFPVIPVSLLLVDRFPSDRRIATVTCPILQIHGQQDSVVPFLIGQKLFDAAPEQSSSGIPRKQIVLPHTDHNNVYTWNPDYERLTDGLKVFLEEVGRQPVSAVPPETDRDAPAVQPVVAPGVLAGIDWTIVGSLLLIAIALGLWWVCRETPKR